MRLHHSNIMMSALRPGRRRASSLANEGARRKALRDAHRWLDELLVDPTQTIESLAIREGKSERSIRMTLALGGALKSRFHRLGDDDAEA